MTTNLTDKAVRLLQPHPTRRQHIIYDNTLKGFGLRVMSSGTKSFVLNYHAAGKERRITIGQYPTWSVQAARLEAARLKRSSDVGKDPLNSRLNERNAATLSDLWNKYKDIELPRKTAKLQKEERSMWENKILPQLGNSKLKDLRPTNVDKLHQEISKIAPISANRTIASLRRALNLAIRWEMCSRNPASGVDLNQEEPRQRHLSPPEIKRFLAALETHPEITSCAALTFLLLTGARKGETLKATWDQFDLASGQWSKPSSHTKQRRIHSVPLSKATIQVLLNLKSTSSCNFVFSKDGKKPLKDIKKTFATICRDADLDDFRIHDLRHTFASLLASNNLSLPIIGRLIGHTQTATTARYAHLYDNPLREAAELVAEKIEQQ